MTADGHAGRPFVRDLRVAALPWLVARLLTAAGYALANVDRFQDLTRPSLHQKLLAWDAAFYGDIAAHGYGAVAPDGLRFFPLLPLLGRGVSVVPGIAPRAGVVIVAWCAALAFGAALHRLVRDETGDAALARTAVWVAMLAPNAFVLGMGYAEGLFLFLSTALFLAVRAKRYDLVILLGVLAGACRPVGVLLAVPVLIVWWRERRERRGLSVGASVVRVGAAVAPGVGALAYLAWAKAAGYSATFLTPLRLQNVPNLRGATEIPGPNLVHALRVLVTGERVGYGLHVVSAVVLVGLVVVCARRLPAEYAAYAGATLLAALSARNLESFERYALAAFPFLIAAAMLLRRWRVERIVLAFSAVAFVVLSAASFGGRYVP